MKLNKLEILLSVTVLLLLIYVVLGTFVMRTGTNAVSEEDSRTGVVYEKPKVLSYEVGFDEEWGSWVQTNSDPEVWYDEITGLYWSESLGEMSNLFDVEETESCDFFRVNLRETYEGNDFTCGEAINTCAKLSLDVNGDGVENSNWYLPSEKEFLQAHINGIEEKTDSDWLTGSYFWSSTGNDYCNKIAWNIYLGRGYNNYNSKGSTFSVRCVLRNL